MANKDKEFTGKLAEKLSPLPKPSILTGIEHYKEALGERSVEELIKLLLLMQHYDIDPAGAQSFYGLSLALARQFVDGFKDKKKLGAKTKWNVMNGAILVVEINWLINSDNSNRRVAWAARQLAQMEPWKSFVEKKGSNQDTADRAEALRVKYYHYRKDRKLVDFFKLVREIYASEDDMDSWNRLIEVSINIPRT